MHHQRVARDIDGEQRPREDGDELTVEVLSLREAGTRAWDRRLSPREKLLRGIMIAASLLAGVAIIFGPGVAASLAATRPPASVHNSRASIAPGSRITQLSAWRSLHTPDADNQPLSFAPAPGDATTIFACGVGSSNHAGIALGPLRLWRTRDAGATWQALSVPRFLANQCDIRAAATAPARLTLLATNTGCQSYAAFVSNDGGDHWATIALPYASAAQLTLSQCDLFVTVRHLYLRYEYEDASSAFASRWALLRSDDDGGTWNTVSASLPSTSSCSVIPSTTVPSGDDVLLASCVAAASSPAQSAVLWRTGDSGRSWHEVGPIPATGAGMLFVSPQPAVAGNSALTPLYAAYNRSTSSAPGSPLSVRLMQTFDGRRWQTLPPLPVAGAATSDSGVRRVLGAALDGRLLVAGVDPGVDLRAAAVASSGATGAGRWIWVWNPATRRWSVVSDPLPELPNLTCQSACWQVQLSWDPGAQGLAQGPYVWAGTAPHNGNLLLRLFLPDVSRTRHRAVGGISLH